MYELRWRILRERLEEMAAASEQAGNENGVRLALCCFVLLERHRVDEKGRCRCCSSRRKWWRRTRRCTVVPVIGFYLEQPTRMVIMTP